MPYVDFAKLTEYYNDKVREEKNIRTADQVMDVITRIVDRDGVHGILDMPLEEEEM